MHTLMSSVLVEDFRIPDTNELVRMWRESFENAVGITDPHSIEEQTEFFQAEVLPKHKVLTAKESGRLIGFIAYTSESISQLYIRLNFQHRGVGKLLLSRAKAESHGSLWLFTFERNKAACDFYESQGFVVEQKGFEQMWQLEDIKYAWSWAASAA